MSKEEIYEADKKRVKKMRDIFEWLVVIFLIVGISTSVLNLSFGGFTPILCSLLSFWFANVFYHYIVV